MRRPRAPPATASICMPRPSTCTSTASRCATSSMPAGRARCPAGSATTTRTCISTLEPAAGGSATLPYRNSPRFPPGCASFCSMRGTSHHHGATGQSDETRRNPLRLGRHDLSGAQLRAAGGGGALAHPRPADDLGHLGAQNADRNARSTGGAPLKLPIRVSPDRVVLYGIGLFLIGMWQFVINAHDPNLADWPCFWVGGATVGTRALLDANLHAAFAQAHGIHPAIWAYLPAFAWLYLPAAHFSLFATYVANAIAMLAIEI